MELKKILFVINTLGQGGAEVALIELIKELPRLTDCTIDLYVMLGQGELIDSIPPYVNVLNKKMDPTDVLSREMKRKGNVAAKNLLWKTVSDGSKPPQKKYDLAIAYIEGASTYFVADKVNADVKAAFFHTDYRKAGYNRKLDHGCYSRFQAIYCVSQETMNTFLSEYPELTDRTHVFRNIIHPESIIEKSKLEAGFDDDFDGIRIVSLGRLVKLKRFDTAIEAAHILKERGHRIRWYVFGEGEERSNLEASINKNGLENEFFLYGTVRNPFPYLRSSHIYVQCSKYEGQSVAVREAKVIGLPIILTLSNGNRGQITDGVDGLYVGADAISIANGIERLIINPELRNNEEKNLPLVFEGMRKNQVDLYADVLIINDASSDRTADIARENGAECISFIFNLGYGNALQMGYKYANENGYLYLIQIDADTQHDPCNIPVIYNALKTPAEDGILPDIVLGSRNMKGSGKYNVGMIKQFAFNWLGTLVRMFGGGRLADPTTGLQGLSRRAFSRYAGFDNFDAKYPDANMILEMKLLGYNVLQVPAIMHLRKSGVSMHSGIWKPAKYMVRSTIALIVARMRGWTNKK